MSWGETPNSNKFKQSYIQGFLDISAGNLIVQKASKIQVKSNSGDGSVTALQIGSTGFDIFAGQSSTFMNYDTFAGLSTIGVSYENTVTDISNRLQFIGSSTIGGNKTLIGVSGGSDLEVFGTLSTKSNGHLFINGDASFNKNVYVTKDLSVNQSLFVTNRSVFNGDVSMSQNLSLTSATQNRSVAINKGISSEFALDVSGATLFRSKVSTVADVSINGKLSVSDDVSLNKNLTVTGIARFGAPPATTAGYELDINGQMRIYEATGSNVTTNTSVGTLTLQHGDANGTSSIMFTSPSTTSNGDYGYIKYQDNSGATTNTGLLTIGIENDPTATATADKISLYAAGGLGYVGVNTLTPTFNLDVSGTTNISSTLTVNKIDASNVASQMDIATNQTSGILNIGTDTGRTANINIGTGTTGAKTIQIGGNAANSTTELRGQTINLGTSSTSSSININPTLTGTLNLGTTISGGTISLGPTVATSASTFNIARGDLSGGTINAFSGNATNNSVLNIATGTRNTGIFSLGSGDTTMATTNVFSGAFTNSTTNAFNGTLFNTTTNFLSGNASNTSVLNIATGTRDSGSTINIATNNTTSAETLNIGTGTSRAGPINIGTGNTGTKTVSIGGTNTTMNISGSTMNINSTGTAYLSGTNVRIKDTGDGQFYAGRLPGDNTVDSIQVALASGVQTNGSVRVMDGSGSTGTITIGRGDAIKIVNGTATTVDISAVGALTMRGSTITFNGSTTFGSDMSLNQNVKLGSGNNSIAINKGISSEFALDVSGATLFRSKVSTVADVSINGKLSVSDDVSLNKNLTVTGTARFGAPPTSTAGYELDINGQMRIYEATGSDVTTNTSVATLTLEHGNASGTSSIMFTSPSTTSNGDYAYIKYQDGSGATTNTGLLTIGIENDPTATTTADKISLYAAGGLGYVGVNTQTPTYNLDVSGTTNISNTLTVNKIDASNVASQMDIATTQSGGALNIGTLTTRTGAINIGTGTTSKTIDVGSTSAGTTTIKGGTTLIQASSVLELGNNTGAATITLGRDITTNGTIGIASATTSTGGTVNVANGSSSQITTYIGRGDAIKIVNGTSTTVDISAAGALTLRGGSKIIAVSDVSMNAKLSVQGDTSLNSNVTVGGNISVSSNTIKTIGIGLQQPPDSMTANVTDIEGHGTYYAYNSSEPTDAKFAYNAYTGILNTPYGYTTIVGDPSINVWSFSDTISDVVGTAYPGYRFHLDMPYQINLVSFSYSTSRFPVQGSMLGSNDGSNWNNIYSFDLSASYNNRTAASIVSGYNSFNITTNTAFYSKYAFVVRSICSTPYASRFSIVNLRLFGSNNILSTQGIGSTSIGVSENLTVGGMANVFGNLTVGSTTTNTSMYTNNAAKLLILEPSGSLASATTGSLVLQHSDVSGASSIVFRSTNNSGSDYGYIQYQENVGGTSEKGLLTIGVENDSGSGTSADRISLFAAAGSGFVGVNTKTPTFNLDVSGTMNVSGKSVFSNDMSLNQNVKLGSGNNSVAINKDISSAFALDVSGITLFRSKVATIADVSINGKLGISDDVSLNSKLFVNTTTNLVGDVSMNSKLFVGADASLNSKLFVNTTTNLVGDASLNSKLFVGGDASLNSKLFVNTTTNLVGDVSMNSKLFVGGDASLNSKLFVNTTTNLVGDVSMNSKLFVGGDASLNSKLFVRGDASLNSKLFVGGDASLNSKLFVNTTTNLVGDASLNSKLFVGGDASLNSKLFVNTTTNLVGDASLNSKLFVGGDASLNSKLFVNTTTNLVGDASLNSKLFVGGDASLNSKLFVNTTTNLVGDASLNSKLFVGGDASLNSKLFVRGDASLNSKLFVGGDASLNSTLFVNTTTNLVGDVSMNSKLFVGGDASLNSKLFVNTTTNLVGDASLNSKLFVGGDASFNNNLALAGSARFGAPPTTTAGYELDINGQMRIYEATGSNITGNTSVATLTLEHGDASGCSSIMFTSPSTTSNGNYAYIKYQDGSGATTNTGLLTIGIENDPTAAATADKISLYAAGGSGYVGVNTQKPTFNLDVSGTTNISNTLTVNKIEPTAITTQMDIATTQTSGILNIGTDAARTGTIKIGNASNTNTIGNFDISGSRIQVKSGTAVFSSLNTTGDIRFAENMSAGTHQYSHNQSSGTLQIASSTRNSGSIEIGNGDNNASHTMNIGNGTSNAGALKIATGASSTGTTTIGRGDAIKIVNSAATTVDISAAGTLTLRGGSKIIAVSDVSMNSKLSVSGDVSLNSNVTVGGNISSSKLLILEPSGSLASATTGSLVLQHSDASGASSIVFRSTNNSGNDYGYIQYQENVGGTSEKGLLTIGVENDSGSGNSADRISLYAAAGSGFVGVNTKTPTFNLDVLGTTNISTSLTVNKIDVSNVASQMDIATTQTNGTLNIGTGDRTGAINIGTGTTGAKTIQIGSNAASSTTELRGQTINLGTSSTSFININPTPGGTLNLGTTISGGILNLGPATTSSGSFNIARGDLTGGTINAFSGNASNTSVLNIATGTRDSGSAINIANNTSSAETLSIGTGANRTGTINIGTGNTGTKTVTIGGTNTTMNIWGSTISISVTGTAYLSGASVRIKDTGDGQFYAGRLPSDNTVDSIQVALASGVQTTGSVSIMNGSGSTGTITIGRTEAIKIVNGLATTVDISAAGALSLRGSSISFTGSTAFSNDMSLNRNVKLGSGTNSVAINKDISSQFALDVSGTMNVSGKLNVGNLISVANSINNKKLVLNDNSTEDNPANATNFFGFGINTMTLRYQTANASNIHKFYSGTSDGNIESGSLKLLNTTQATNSTTGALIVDGGVGIAQNLIVAKDVSLNKNLTVTGTARFGAPPTSTAGYELDINGQMRIYEATGSNITGNTSVATLTLEHGDANGTSSIMFTSPSTTSNGDYAYIKYQDGSGATTNTGLLTIGIENDPTATTTADKISLYAAGGLGYVGVNTLTPQQSLDVSGQMRIYEGVGTAASDTSGTLILEHANAGGTSSLVFKGPNSVTKDYAYVQYQDNTTDSVSSTYKWDLSTNEPTTWSNTATFASTGKATNTLKIQPSDSSLNWLVTPGTKPSGFNPAYCISFNQTNVFDASATRINYLETDVSYSSTFSLSLWFYPTLVSVFNKYITVAALSQGVAGYSAEIAIDGNTQNLALLANNGVAIIQTGNSSVIVNTWHHLVFTYNSITRQSKLYLNNSLQGSTTSTAINTYNWLTIGMRFGQTTGSAAKGFRGGLCYVNLFNNELSQSDVSQLYEKSAYTPTSTEDRGLLTIGIENESGYVNNDRIALWPGAGQGLVGINTQNPQATLDVSGNANVSSILNVSNTLTVNKIEPTVINGQMDIATTQTGVLNIGTGVRSGGTGAVNINTNGSSSASTTIGGGSINISGSGDLTLNTSYSGSINIVTGNRTAGTFNLGSGTTSNSTINAFSGNASNTSVLNIATGTRDSGSTINIATNDTTSAETLNIGTGTARTGTINIGTGTTGVKNMRIGGTTTTMNISGSIMNINSTNVLTINNSQGVAANLITGAKTANVNIATGAFTTSNGILNIMTGANDSSSILNIANSDTAAGNVKIASGTTSTQTITIGKTEAIKIVNLAGAAATTVDISAGGALTLRGSTIITQSDVSMNSKLFVGGDASFNNNLAVTGTAKFGAPPTTTAGYELDINGQMRIYEATGSNVTSNTSVATLTLQHGDASGCSSIMFTSPSTTSNGDYAYIKYQDFSGATTNAGLLTIGIENDPTAAATADKISLYAAGGSGYVGVNTLTPSYNLDVSGTFRVTGATTAAAITATTISASTSLTTGTIIATGTANLYATAATTTLNMGTLVPANSTINIGNSTDTVNTTLKIGGNIKLGSGSKYVTVNKDPSLNFFFDVSGDSLFRNNLTINTPTRNNSVAINKDISSQYALDVSGESLFRNNLTINSDLSVNQSFFVTNRSLFAGDVSMNQNLSLTSALRNRSVAINKDISSQYALDVSGESLFRGTVNTTGTIAVTNGGSINVTGGGTILIDGAQVVGGSAGTTLTTNGVKIGNDTNYYVSVNKPNFYNDPSLTIYYSFDTSINNGTQVQNLAKPGTYDGSLNNNGVLGTGMIDTSIRKYGTASLKNDKAVNNGMKILSATPIPVTNTMSFSLWVNYTLAPTTRYRIFEFSDYSLTGQTPESNTIALDISGNGVVYPVLTSGSATCFTTLTAPIVPYTLTNTGWNHIVWVITPTISYIYVNGAISQVDNITTPVPNSDRANANIAYPYVSTTNYEYPGNLDEFRWYTDKVLNEAEIYQLNTNIFYTLDISSGFLANGASVIYEPIGSKATANSGTLTLLHGDPSGSSSILFKSVNDPFEYGYIQYEENSAGSTGYHFGLMTIGIENDAGAGAYTTQADRVSLFPSGGRGFVGVNTKTPQQALDVSGQMRIFEGIGTVASDTSGTLILEHANAGGTSSLVFKGPNSITKDYAYVQYQDNTTNTVSSIYKWDLSTNVPTTWSNTATFASTGTATNTLKIQPSDSSLNWLVTPGTKPSGFNPAYCISFNQTNVFDASATRINYLQADVSYSSTFSLSLWFYPTLVSVFNKYITIASLSSQSGGAPITAEMAIDGNTQNFTMLTGSGTVITQTAASSVIINTWHHVVFTYNSLTTQSKIYLNGSLQASTTSTAISSYNLLLIGMRFGQTTGTIAKGFRGGLCYVNLFNNELSQSDVSQLYEKSAYTPTSTDERGLMTIGIENENGFINNDRIVLWPGAGQGFVGINTRNPQATLDVSGQVQAFSYNATSDYRAKDEVVPLNTSFNVDSLNPVTYKFKATGRQDIGFIAHEVQEFYPFLVNGEKDGPNNQSLNYNGFIGILTKEIQDLKKKVSDQEARALAQEARALAQEARALAQDARIQSLEKMVFDLINK